MKKIVLFSLIACLGFVDSGVGATYNCTVQSISALSWKYSNEFLFPTNADYKDANGRALVCGHRKTEGCDNGTVVVVAGNHWWQKEQSDYMNVYRCSTGGANAWADVGYTALKECSADQKKKWAKIGEINNQKILCDDSLVNTFYKGGYCTNACFTSECPDCEKTDVSPVETCAGGFQLGKLMDTKDCKNVNVSDSDLKTGKECKKVCLKNTGTGEVKGMWYISECPSGKKGVAFSNPNKYSPAVTGYKKCISDALSCKESRSTEEGKACCDLPNSVAEWKAPHCVCTDSNLEFKIVNGKGKCVAKQSCESLYKGNARAIACCNSTEATWDAINNVCLCNDETKNWDYNQNKCVDGEGDDGSVTPIPSDDKVCYYSFVGDVKCANGNSYNINKQIPVNNTSSQDCETFLKTYEADRNNILKIQQEICAKQGSYFIVINQAQIDAAQSKISSFFNTAESDASVWKDAEGKFNTARLASDLTAGVVLGTVGGVVSGVVIKKKQVEKGFEALHCTVGGQPIADWGDTFNVGLR